MSKILIENQKLSIEDIVNVARFNFKVKLGDSAKERINTARAVVDKFVAEGKVSYGITTGFGKFSDVVISKEETNDLQRNLIISHACGVGEPFAEEIVRAMMVLRVNSLTKGNSGIRLLTVEKLIELLNKEVHPVIPEKGSLGASGDLAPLSHMVLTMLGLGEAFYKGERMDSVKALELAGIEPLPYLTSKEGLALINGTQAMTAVGVLTIYDALNLSKIADIAGALTMEALTGIKCALDPRVHKVRGHSGQIDTAKNLLNLIDGSKMITKQGDLRVQDAYALRCMPQIHGASKDALRFIKEKIEIEVNAVTDNPLIFPETEESISAGNFHGQPMALPLDYMGIALAELANVSERRLERLVNPALSNGLPAFLTKFGGVHSGFMIVQYSAASVVSENKVLAHPASVDSIPSSANQEDHVSMGTIAGRKAREIMKNARHVIAMEILGACQAIDLREENFLGRGTEIAYNFIREDVKFVNEDVVMYKYINKCYELISNKEMIDRVEEVVGELL
ncbi:MULTISPECIES: histidine ammonia-lyase [Psychrilyobacter]|uniref:Histidine ammonia-lyase n=1 Tax=Psychrilyobacter piezotolerans TaxID=2293438 RepID=A0ABX9KKR4_9FUSO|nr:MULTISPECIES: histidine ammonia-lyase [Psychrilyobacter]MCS5421910.1 histidine ammonia-lyase [Psychrilyobacter sp. S5]NDI77077.1 histidine ammonia-lyase [Psychrilyobacter piezotolerans]RDE64693.1 histidine ammonia-lyase [Psychrilyobacter sp. S5]REI42505.1 histidine ammonia-lyase [Psychrilyobacter piezotolerans]